MTRRRLTERQVIAVLLQQRAVIPCYRCRHAFKADDAKEIEREHIHELALGGADDPENMCFSHRACHAEITNGTKATSAGSSKNKIAKVRRLSGTNKPRFKRKIPARVNPWQKGRKIASRPFSNGGAK